MSVNSRLVNPLTTQLFEAILLLENVDECYEFFEDLCTVNELHDMSQLSLIHIFFWSPVPKREYLPSRTTG